jgi:predicted nucleic acid-binding protein
VDEVRRNVQEKLARALPLFERFLTSSMVSVVAPSAAELASARGRADRDDEAILAAALAAGATILTTHNVRHFTAAPGLRVMRPGELVEEIRAWMAGFAK